MVSGGGGNVVPSNREFDFSVREVETAFSLTDGGLSFDRLMIHF